MTDLKGTTVLVTGAGGFIASHLVELLLREGARVRAFTRYNSRNHPGYLEDVKRGLGDKSGAVDNDMLERLEIVFGDITDPFAVSSAVEGCSVVFHLAALIGIPYSYVAPASYIAVNVNGTLNILEACRRHGVERCITTSTSETYGTAQYTPIDEKHPPVGQSPYAASKVAADQLAMSYYRSFEAPVIIIRPFNTYGPRQSMRAVLPTILVQALRNLQSSKTDDAIEIRLGSLDPVRDLTYVLDTARGFVAAAKAPISCVGKAYNLGAGLGASIGELVQLTEMILDREINVRTDPQRVRPEKSEVWTLIAENSLARDELGWRPEISLEKGIRLTSSWIDSCLEKWDSNEYVI